MLSQVHALNTCVPFSYAELVCFTGSYAERMCTLRTRCTVEVYVLNTQGMYCAVWVCWTHCRCISWTVQTCIIHVVNTYALLRYAEHMYFTVSYAEHIFTIFTVHGVSCTQCTIKIQYICCTFFYSWHELNTYCIYCPGLQRYVLNIMLNTYICTTEVSAEHVKHTAVCSSVPEPPACLAQLSI